RRCRTPSTRRSTRSSTSISSRWQGAARVGSPLTSSMENSVCCVSNACPEMPRRVPHGEASRRAGCRDVAPVAGLMRATYVMEVNPSVPVDTVPEFIAYAKAHPGKLNMASAGSGTPQHVAGELFKAMTGVSMLHVPYRGAAPALADLLGGQVQVMF